MGKKEEKIKTYLKSKNGEKLEELEKGLVLYEDCINDAGRFSLYLSLYKDNSDLLCFNKRDKAIVPIEIKSGNATHYTFGQILYYLAGAEDIKCANLKGNLKGDEQNVTKVRGIVLAKKIDKPFEIIIKKYKNCIPEIGLITYTEDGDGNFHFDVKSPLDA
jgi:hypothetical protein